MKKLIDKTKNILKNVGITYLLLGELWGISDTSTTYHASVDVYLGKKQPSYFEELLVKEVYENFGKELPNWLEDKKEIK